LETGENQPQPRGSTSRPNSTIDGSAWLQLPTSCLRRLFLSEHGAQGTLAKCCWKLIREEQHHQPWWIGPVSSRLYTTTTPTPMTNRPINNSHPSSMIPTGPACSVFSAGWRRRPHRRNPGPATFPSAVKLDSCGGSALAWQLLTCVLKASSMARASRSVDWPPLAAALHSDGSSLMRGQRSHTHPPRPLPMRRISPNPHPTNGVQRGAPG
jgi:hypothetical protein